MTLWKKISSMEVKCICILRPSNISLMCVWHVCFFNWRMITFQYCVDFCHATWWISHKYTYVPSLLNLALPCTPLDCHRRPDWFPWAHIAASHWLLILHIAVYTYVNATLSIHLTISFPHYVRSVLYVYVSCPATRFMSIIFLDSIHMCTKKDLQNPDNHDGVITHLEPDILEYEVKLTLGSITTNKARRWWNSS